MSPRLLTAALWVAAALLGCGGAWLLLTGLGEPARTIRASSTSTPSMTPHPTPERNSTTLPGRPAPPERATRTTTPELDETTSTTDTPTPPPPAQAQPTPPVPVPARPPLVDEQSAPTATGPEVTADPEGAALDQLRRAFPNHVDPDVGDPLLVAAWEGLEADLKQAGLDDVERRAALLLDPVTDTTATAVLQVTHAAPGADPEVRTYQVDLTAQGERWMVGRIHIP